MILTFLNLLPSSKHFHVITSIPNVFFTQARAASAACPSRTSKRERHLRHLADAPLRLEAGARHVLVHRVRPLLVGVPGHRDAASRSRRASCCSTCATTSTRTRSRCTDANCREGRRHRRRDGPARSSRRGAVVLHTPAAPAKRPARSTSSTSTRSSTCAATSCRRPRASPPSSPACSRAWRRRATRGASAPTSAPTGPRASTSRPWPRTPRPSTCSSSAAPARSTTARKKITKAVAKLLKAAGVSFAILGSDEPCNGDTARRLGNEYLYQVDGQMARRRPSTATTSRRSSPTARTASTPSRTSSRSSAATTRCVHATELVADLITSGRLKLDGVAGRHSRLPRLVLPRPLQRRLRRARAASSRRCPASTSRKPDAHEELRHVLRRRRRPHVDRGEARAARERRCASSSCSRPRPTTIASACPYCMTMLTDGVKDKDLEDSVKNRDVLELVADAIVA